MKGVIKAMWEKKKQKDWMLHETFTYTEWITDKYIAITNVFVNNTMFAEFCPLHIHITHIHDKYFHKNSTATFLSYLEELLSSTLSDNLFL